MAGIPSSTDVVFADLRDALAELRDSRSSPREVRRAFVRFVDLTQRLTSAMRTDYSRTGRGAWAASEFAGWSPVTDYFKWLRNQDQHDTPIRVSVHERRFYAVPGFDGELFPVEGTWVLGDQLADRPPDGITFYPTDPLTGKALDPVAPVRIEYQYLVQPHSEDSRLRLQAIGTTDLHWLSTECFAVLEKYHAFYVSRAGT